MCIVGGGWRIMVPTGTEKKHVGDFFINVNYIKTPREGRSCVHVINGSIPSFKRFWRTASSIQGQYRYKYEYDIIHTQQTVIINNSQSIRRVMYRIEQYFWRKSAGCILSAIDGARSNSTAVTIHTCSLDYYILTILYKNSSTAVVRSSDGFGIAREQASETRR